MCEKKCKNCCEHKVIVWSEKENCARCMDCGECFYKKNKDVTYYYPYHYPYYYPYYNEISNSIVNQNTEKYVTN